MWIRTTETSWWRTTETSLPNDVSFETCLRRRGDKLIGRCCYVPLRRRHNIQIRRRGNVLLRHLSYFVGCFIWDMPATSLGRTERVVTTSSRRLVAGWVSSSFCCYKFYISMFFHIFHSFSKNCVIHKLKRSFSKLFFAFFQDMILAKHFD